MIVYGSGLIRLCALMMVLAESLLFVCLHSFCPFSDWWIICHTRSTTCQQTEPTQVRTKPNQTMTLLGKLQDSKLRRCFCLSDEVAKFLLHVKTLSYQDNPDYQHLQDLLSISVSGRLDFSLPTGPTAGPLNELREMSCSDEVRTPADRNADK